METLRFDNHAVDIASDEVTICSLF
jgi:hypothetical protein